MFIDLTDWFFRGPSGSIHLSVNPEPVKEPEQDNGTCCSNQSGYNPGKVIPVNKTADREKGSVDNDTSYEHHQDLAGHFPFLAGFLVFYV